MSSSLIMVVFFTLSCLSLTGLVKGEMFTALIHMEGLLDMEKNLLQQLNTYIANEKTRLNRLEHFAKRVEKAIDTANEQGGMTQHLHDPVNVFQLVNRYTNGWMKIHETIDAENGQDLMANISLSRHRFPTEEDYVGAMTALRRLQDTYRLEPSTIAQGKLGSKTGLPMTSSDCYIIGREAYNEKNWRHTRDWMLAALKRFDEEGGDNVLSNIDIPSIYEHLAFAEYSLGNLRKAAQHTQKLLQYDPYHERAIDNRHYFMRLSLEEPNKFVDAVEQIDNESDRAKYEKLCREADPIPPHLHKKLFCYYHNNNRNPRLILKPIKTEIAFLEPEILIYHDFVTDAEIERLKELANPKLNRATVLGKNGELLHSTYRISKSGWLSSFDDPLGYVDRIDQRIEDTTGLDMSTAEQLQVVNYGIGGHYEPHYDFASTGEDVFSSFGNGNRISTLLIYLSNVELGGATAFPLVGARLAPIKGSAAYWWNLKKSGEGDYSTRHAGCPVLVGSKWVCNKWIHERGQEFRRPCGLSPNE